MMRWAQIDVQVVWFKRDLRVGDYRTLAKAADRGPVIPLYICEPELWRQPDMAARHWGFVSECLEDVRATLTAIGQPLAVRTESVIGAIEEIDARFGIAALWSHEETGNAWNYVRDRAVDSWCRGMAVPWHQVRQTGVIRGLRSRDGWAAKWDQFMAEPFTPPPAAVEPVAGVDIGRVPSATDLDLISDPCPGHKRGGLRVAVDRLNSFLTTRGATCRTAMSSALKGFEDCSRLSPHLAWGTLSMRDVAQATWA